MDEIECRIGCAACCVVLAIPGPFFGHPDGKPAAVRCNNLTDDNRCGIWEQRPAVCRNFVASRRYCGGNDAEAYFLIARLSDTKKRVQFSPVVVSNCG
jgi:hypothetical protein